MNEAKRKNNHENQSLKHNQIFRSLSTQQIPFSTNDLAILICNSNVRHELSDSEYPTRRKQCAEALRLMNLKSFREAKLEHLAGKQHRVHSFKMQEK